MRYRVEIETGLNASAVADAVAHNHGSWSRATDGVGGVPGVVFIDSIEGEDDDLCAEMDSHSGVIGYDEFNPVDPQFTMSDAQWSKVLELRERELTNGS